MHFDPGDLRLFLSILERGSITAGASAAHLSLPAASARLRTLETRCGAPLFLRDRRGVQPTPAGRSFAYHARVLLQQIERMREEMSEYAHGLRGQVRLLGNSSALGEHLPELLAGFLLAHPQLDVDVREAPSHRIVEQLAQGMADLGILADSVALGPLQSLPFRDDTLCAVLPAGHALAPRQRIRFTELLAFEHVALPADSALALHLDERARASAGTLRVRCRLPGFDALASLVARGVGVGVLPLAAAQRCQRHLPLRAIPLDEPWAVRWLQLCARHVDALPAPAAALLRHLRAAAHNPAA